MKGMSWFEILEVVVKKILSALAKVLVFLIWTTFKGVEILLHELNESMHRYLFKNGG